MKKLFLLLGLVFILAFAAACGGADTPTPESATATPPQEATQEPVTEPEGLPEVTVVPVMEIQGIDWQWAELLESEPAAQSLVPDPEKYSLVLWDDGTYNFQADCNVGSGGYTADDNGSLSLEPGPMTLVMCEPDSLSDQYLALLSGVTSFGVRDNRLVLVVNEGRAQMVFNNAGPAEKPEPEPEFCAGVELRSVTIDTFGLPYSWVANCLPGNAYDATQPPTPVGLPEHVQINFGVTHPADRQFGDPILYIIPVEAYIELWESAGDSSVAESIAQLKSLLSGQPEPVPASSIPVLPYEEVSGVVDIGVQGEYLNTSMGSGVRFVGRFSQGPNPVTNDNPPLFYIYQGFTEDGQYLISFFYPVTTDELPGADQVSEEERAMVDSDPTTYLATKTEQLNALVATDWEPPLTTLDAVIDSLGFEYMKPEPPPAPAAQLTHINWEWTELIQTDPASQSVIANPQSYVLVFYEDGTFYVLADCNFGSGSYTLNGNQIALQVGAMTQVVCGEGSLSEQFLVLLGQVATYELTTTKLALNLGDNAGSLGFANGGPSVPVTPPDEGAPTAITIEPINVRSGPGTAYFSYGTVPIGTTFLVTGISEDGGWWVVRIPVSVAPDGLGWINANYVETRNTENVPVVPNPDVQPSPTPAVTGTPGVGPTSTPAPGGATATATVDVNIRSGPGTNYLSYGIMPAGTSAPVIGVSEDGGWWVIQISTDLATDGRGWVSADFVTVTNGDGVPVVPAPPLP